MGSCLHHVTAVLILSMRVGDSTLLTARRSPPIALKLHICRFVMYGWYTYEIAGCVRYGYVENKPIIINNTNSNDFKNNSTDNNNNFLLLKCIGLQLIRKVNTACDVMD